MDLEEYLHLTKVKEDVVILKSLEIVQHLFGLAGREEHIELTRADQAAHKGVFSVYSTFVGQRCR